LTLSIFNVNSIYIVKVKFYNSIKTFNRRRLFTKKYWHFSTKAWGAKRIRDPSSPRCQRWIS